MGLLITISLFLAACAGTATRLPEISAPALRAESLRQEVQALGTQTAHLERLNRVGRPILEANAEICPKTRKDLGLRLHQEDSYPKELRLAAQRELGASAEPSVAYIVPGGPADRAGFAVGDVILIDGQPVDAKDRRLEELLLMETVTLTVRRQDSLLNLSVTPGTVCQSRLRLQTSSAINAFANGRSITVTTGMMDFAKSDDELAMIIGHELAHNTMGHIRKVIGNLILSGFSTRYTRPFESEADYVGLYYMVRAGYNPDEVEELWRRLADVDPRSVNRAKTHPTFPDRYLRIAASRDEIRAKQAAGEPLIPNFKSKETDEDSPNG